MVRRQGLGRQWSGKQRFELERGHKRLHPSSGVSEPIIESNLVAQDGSANGAGQGTEKSNVQSLESKVWGQKG
jgi:hypothetical protein